MLIALQQFLRRGTLHLDIAREDWLAYEKLRLQIHEQQNPLKVPVFDMALFISMSMECSSILQAHERVRRYTNRPFIIRNTAAFCPPLFALPKLVCLLDTVLTMLYSAFATVAKSRCIILVWGFLFTILFACILPNQR